MFSIDYSHEALIGIDKLRKSEPLKGTSVPTWSRKISSKHRLVYEVDGYKVKVYILTAYGHYNDK